jgi:hypothetical protein
MYYEEMYQLIFKLKSANNTKHDSFFYISFPCFAMMQCNATHPPDSFFKTNTNIDRINPI